MLHSDVAYFWIFSIFSFLCRTETSSRIVVCMFSKHAVNNPENDINNFGKLTVDSRCDTFLLDLRLALELHDLGLIERIVPVMIGELVSADSDNR